MDKRETTKQIMASAFFAGGIVLIVLFIFTIGKDKGFYQQKFQINMHFSNVGGLVEGAPVRLHGVNIGNVATIDFLENELNGRKVSVKANVFSRYKERLKEGTRFTIQTEGVLGEKLVEIYSLEGQPQVDLERPIDGEEPMSVTNMAQQFAELAQSFTKTADEFSKVDVVSLTQVMEESSRALLVTSEGVNDMMEDLKEITRKSKRVIDRLEEKIVEGNLFTVF